jgi:hypothetical protein
MYYMKKLTLSVSQTYGYIRTLLGHTCLNVGVPTFSHLARGPEHMITPTLLVSLNLDVPIFHVR